jgi:hypothetical protein
MDRDNYEKFTLGILNILLTSTHPLKIQQYLQTLQLITSDNFGLFLNKIENVSGIF